MRLRIMVDGDEAFVTDLETGKSLPCTAVKLNWRAGEAAKLRLELVSVPVVAEVRSGRPRDEDEDDGDGLDDEDDDEDPRPDPNVFPSVWSDVPFIHPHEPALA